MDWLQPLSSVAGLLSFIIVAIGAFFMLKSGIGKNVSEAQQSAITALQAEVTTLRSTIKDVQRENTRLEQTLETICAALMAKGMIVSIQGEMVNIQEGKSVTTTRIHAKIQKIEDE